MPGSSRIHRSIQGHVYYSRSTQFPAPPQWFPPTFYPVSGPMPSASSLITRPLAVPVPPPAAEPVPLHYQQPYPPFPTPVRMTSQFCPETNFVQAAASSYTTHRSLPAGDPVVVRPEDHKDPAVEFKSLAKEFPFSYVFPIASPRSSHTSLETSMKMRSWIVLSHLPLSQRLSLTQYQNRRRLI